MKQPATPRLHPLAPLALGAALAGHAAADAKTADLANPRASGPDPVVGASAEAAREMGKAWLGLNKVPEALQAYRQALAQDPDSVEALNGMAVCFDRLGRFEDARTHYEAALGIDPTSPVLLNNYGLSLYLQGAYDESARFLRLAAAAGDPAVQAAALRTLAKIENGNRAPVQTAAVQASPAESGPRIVRTSGHEQRLVLGSPKGAAPVRFAATTALSGEDTAAMAAIGGLSDWDDARIASREAGAIASEQEAAARAEARREAARLLAEARAATPADMQVAALLEAARKAAANAPATQEQATSPWGDPADPLLQSPVERDWYRDQILVIAPASAGQARREADRASAGMAMLAAGLAPPRNARREALAAAARKALDEAAPRRQFGSPFASDNDRLNGFAERLHRPDEEPAELSVAEKVALLEQLIERVKAA
ncbi:tetratricopeptide repeat protein [Sandaracinobacter neustonicus]|uniref:Tetratricopeptide repeat protein n=1 Tax=Sandaracinobacter neustonicus TaxID=1715348 RepID=A0A501XNT8_9SPHN|nr:tetratricopeptide repeat protein [Sandaracinobacter neustonicus]TPE61817.1 tetratricopeptide repeat protein [Sandaracinobacter neustonicus]